MSDKNTFGGYHLVNVINALTAHFLLIFLFFIPFQKFFLFLFAFGILTRIIGVNIGMHRYFSHRSFKTSRFFQFILGFVATSANQGGPLWWASNHRLHHKYSDTPLDPHSPIIRNFFWAQFLWYLEKEKMKTNNEIIKDLNKYPEIIWLNKNKYLVLVLWAIPFFMFWGWAGVLWGVVFPNVVSMHVTQFIVSLAHLIGSQRYKTNDHSKNSFLLGFLIAGEGWHNNHHYFPSSARQGFYWWEIDLGYYIIKIFSGLKLIWDVQVPPKKLLVKEV
jgi:stearoyl-CoA desaturase (delta-9 desaturase)